MNRFFILLIVSAGLFAARAQSPDEQYVHIYQMIQEADRLNDSGQTRPAAAKYIEAQEALNRFRGIYPGWNDRVINYRLHYVATKLAPLASSLAGTPPSLVHEGTASIVTNTPRATNATISVAAIPPSTAPPMSAEFENQLKALQTEVERLQGDNRLLAARLKEALSVQPAAVDPRELTKAEERIRTLLKENELFKAQLAHKTSAPSAQPPDFAARLAEQTDIIAALRVENEVLKKQSSLRREKDDALMAVANTARSTPTPAASSPDTELALRKLNADNIAWQKQAELWKQVANNNQRQAASNANATMPLEALRELASIRARLKVLEAKPVPYTPEELALFAKSSPPLINTEVAVAHAGPVSRAAIPPAEGPLPTVARGVPSGAGTLVLAAERAFAATRYSEAEQKYLEVLHQQPENVTMLANVASAQLEAAHFADAETNVQHALRLDPEDHFTLYLLGRLRFRQDKLDEALDALSRSARSNPDYPATQNYLGIVLSEKGLRAPAEAALRKAIQLQPDYAAAHNNLAVVYATQSPPALALARWHYKKAREAGHPPNAELEKLLR